MTTSKPPKLPPRKPPKPTGLLVRSRDYFHPLPTPESLHAQSSKSRLNGLPSARQISDLPESGKQKLIGKFARWSKGNNPKNGESKGEPDRVCKDCDAFSFRKIIGAGVASDSVKDESTILFCKPVENILEKRNVCNFCGLLFDSLCQEDNDPLLHPVVKDFLQDELKEKLGFPGQFSTNRQADRPFKAWAESYWPVFRHGITEGKWPFGTTKDENEASQAAVNGILAALKERVNTEDFDNVANHNGGLGLETVLQGAQLGTLGMGAMGMVSQNSGLSAAGGKINSAAQFASVQMAFSSRHMKNKLTCWIIGVAQKGSSRITIRTFAHGRAPRAPLLAPELHF